MHRVEQSIDDGGWDVIGASDGIVAQFYGPDAERHAREWAAEQDAAQEAKDVRTQTPAGYIGPDGTGSANSAAGCDQGQWTGTPPSGAAIGEEAEPTGLVPIAGPAGELTEAMLRYFVEVNDHQRLRLGAYRIVRTALQSERSQADELRQSLDDAVRAAETAGYRPDEYGGTETLATAIGKMKSRLTAAESERDEARGKLRNVSNAIEPYLLRLALRGQDGIYASDAVKLLVADLTAAESERDKLHRCVRWAIDVVTFHKIDRVGDDDYFASIAQHIVALKTRAEKAESARDEARAALDALRKRLREPEKVPGLLDACAKAYNAVDLPLLTNGEDDDRLLMAAVLRAAADWPEPATTEPHIPHDAPSATREAMRREWAAGKGGESEQTKRLAARIEAHALTGETPRNELGTPCHEAAELSRRLDAVEARSPSGAGEVRR